MYKSPFNHQLSTSKSSEMKIKRKSPDLNDVDTENRSPNSPPRITHSNSDLTDSTTKKIKRFFARETPSKNEPEIVKPKTSLPRYTRAASKPLSAGEIKKQTVTEQNTAERIKTPVKTEMGNDQSRHTSKTPGSGVRTRRSRRSLLRVTAGGRIKSYFENCAIPNEEKVNEMISQKLKSKCKWDIKDKSKRQGEVIMDLKNTLKTTLDEFKTIKTNCEIEERTTEEIIRDLKLELEEATNAAEDIRKSENSLKKEYIRVSNDFNNASSQLKAIQIEFGPLKKQALTLESHLQEKITQYNHEHEKRIIAEASVDGLKKEIMDMKYRHEEMAESLKQHYEQVQYMNNNEISYILYSNNM
jgi:hypothetical protein